ncbi:hypothetical protein FACS1894205_3080 [Alphaproteobacteria bacterium]|nr:hypothetical protein FACS1894205_3080 [Alphaproteobacteria bacterium]
MNADAEKTIAKAEGLELRLIDNRSPPDVLRKIVAFESVHPIRDENDLRNRMAENRRIYGLFHKGSVDGLVVFVEAAVIRGRCGGIQRLLDETPPADDARESDRVIFYSINNARKGLVRNSFAGLLIKMAAMELRERFPSLAFFSTLSPIPGFGVWLDEHLREGEETILSPGEEAELDVASGEKGVFRTLLSTAWRESPRIAQAMKTPLLRLCARYLLSTVQKGGRSPRAIDAVENFHLSNGAFVERINWLGDISEKGMKQSAGLLVNYLYDFSKTDSYGRLYRETGEIVSSPDVKALAGPQKAELSTGGF